MWFARLKVNHPPRHLTLSLSLSLLLSVSNNIDVEKINVYLYKIPAVVILFVVLGTSREFTT